MFSYGSCVFLLSLLLVLALTFWSTIHFELFFVHSAKYGLGSLYLHMQSSCSNTICYKDYPFPIELAWHSCKKSILSVYLGTLSYSADLLFFCLCISTLPCFLQVYSLGIRQYSISNERTQRQDQKKNRCPLVKRPREHCCNSLHLSSQSKDWPWRPREAKVTGRSEAVATTKWKKIIEDQVGPQTRGHRLIGFWNNQLSSFFFFRLVLPR